MTEERNIEYREIDGKTGRIPENITRDIIAFLNSTGGTVLLYRDKEESELTSRIKALVNENISENALSFITITSKDIEKKHVTVLQVMKGSSTPYYLKKSGLSPKGVFVREDGETRNATRAEIGRMLLVSLYGAWEDMPSDAETLHFREAENFLRNRGKRFGFPTLRNSNGDYTNLALLLSDECPFTTRIMEFDDITGIDLIEKEEINGSLVTQMEKIIKRLKQTDDYSYEAAYPEKALREIVSNALLHRDYTFNTGNIISIYPDRITITSCGSVLPPVTVETLSEGITSTRNPKLVNVFQLMGLCSGAGIGTRIIREEARKNLMEATFRESENLFSVTLRKLENLRLKADGSIYDYTPDYNNVILFDGHSTKERNEQNELDEIYSYILSNQVATRKDIEEMLGIRTTKAYSLLMSLIDKGMIVQEKKGRSSFYHLP